MNWPLTVFLHQNAKPGNDEAATNCARIFSSLITQTTFLGDEVARPALLNRIIDDASEPIPAKDRWFILSALVGKYSLLFGQHADVIAKFLEMDTPLPNEYLATDEFLNLCHFLIRVARHDRAFPQWCKSVHRAESRTELTADALIRLIDELVSVFGERSYENFGPDINGEKANYRTSLSTMLSNNFEANDPSMNEARIFFRHGIDVEDRALRPVDSRDRAIADVLNQVREPRVLYTFNLLKVHRHVAQCRSKFHIQNADDIAHLYQEFYRGFFRRLGLPVAIDNANRSDQEHRE